MTLCAATHGVPDASRMSHGRPPAGADVASLTVANVRKAAIVNVFIGTGKTDRLIRGGEPTQDNILKNLNEIEY